MNQKKRRLRASNVVYDTGPNKSPASVNLLSAEDQIILLNSASQNVKKGKSVNIVEDDEL